MTICTWIFPVWLCPSGWVQTRAWCPGKCSAQNFSPSCLRPVYGQAVVRAVPWVKADDVVVALYVLPFLVLAVAEIGAHTGNGKILPATIQRGYAVILPRYQPPVFIKDGLHGKLVMLKCEIGFRCAIVRIFRADMFECCQQRHPLSARLQTLGQQGRKPPPVPPRQAAGRGCADSFSVRAIWLRLPPILPYSAVSFPTAESNSSLTGDTRL